LRREEQLQVLDRIAIDTQELLHYCTAHQKHNFLPTRDPTFPPYLTSCTCPSILCRPRLLIGSPYHAPKETRLVEWVGVGSPVGEEQAKANSLENASERTNGDGVEWTLLSEDLRDELG
jgi:hypothetical protein